MSDPAPRHGGTPAEMLNDLADFLDGLDEFARHATIHVTGKPPTNLYDLLNPDGESPGAMQDDVRWLAAKLETDAGVIDRLKAALAATGVRQNIVDAIVAGGDPDGGLVTNEGDDR